jgi:hypothetical protein
MLRVGPPAITRVVAAGQAGTAVEAARPTGQKDTAGVSCKAPGRKPYICLIIDHQDADTHTDPSKPFGFLARQRTRDVSAAAYRGKPGEDTAS